MKLIKWIFTPDERLSILTRFIPIIIICLLLTNCKERELISQFGCSGSNYFVRQTALGLTFKDSQTLFNKYPKDSIKFGYYTKPLVYYKNKGSKVFLTYTIITTNPGNADPKYFLSIGEIAELSAVNSIKWYYFDWPNGELDSLYADYKSEHTPYDNNCCCSAPLQALTYNNKNYIRKSDFDANGIFVFE